MSEDPFLVRFKGMEDSLAVLIAMVALVLCLNAAILAVLFWG